MSNQIDSQPGEMGLWHLARLPDLSNPTEQTIY